MESEEGGRERERREGGRQRGMEGEGRRAINKRNKYARSMYDITDSFMMAYG